MSSSTSKSQERPNKIVSIISPTIPSRRNLLLERCIASVKRQTYPNIEHIVVQDGPSPDGIADPEGVIFLKLGRNWRNFLGQKCIGGVARYVGVSVARGEYIGYLDDDDHYTPDHVEKLVSLIEEKNCDFAFSRMNLMNSGKVVCVIGDGSIKPGRIGTPMVIHRASCLMIANWKPLKCYEDYTLFRKWERAKLKFAFLNQVTVSARIGPNYR